MNYILLVLCMGCLTLKVNAQRCLPPDSAILGDWQLDSVNSYTETAYGIQTHHFVANLIIRFYPGNKAIFLKNYDGDIQTYKTTYQILQDTEGFHHIHVDDRRAFSTATPLMLAQISDRYAVLQDLQIDDKPGTSRAEKNYYLAKKNLPENDQSDAFRGAWNMNRPYCEINIKDTWILRKKGFQTRFHYQTHPCINPQKDTFNEYLDNSIFFDSLYNSFSLYFTGFPVQSSEPFGWGEEPKPVREGMPIFSIITSAQRRYPYCLNQQENTLSLGLPKGDMKFTYRIHPNNITLIRIE